MSKLAANPIYEAVTELHIQKLYKNIRRLDHQEVTAASGDVLATIYKSVAMSEQSYAVSVGDELLYIIGIVRPTMLGGIGIPWLLGTNAIKRNKKAFLRSSYALLKQTKQRYTRLENHVDARNTDSIKWLIFMGFELEDARPFGREQKPFHRFYWSK